MTDKQKKRKKRKVSHVRSMWLRATGMFLFLLIMAVLITGLCYFWGVKEFIGIDSASGYSFLGVVTTLLAGIIVAAVYTSKRKMHEATFSIHVSLIFAILMLLLFFTTLRFWYHLETPKGGGNFWIELSALRVKADDLLQLGLLFILTLMLAAASEIIENKAENRNFLKYLNEEITFLEGRIERYSVNRENVIKRNDKIRITTMYVFVLLTPSLFAMLQLMSFMQESLRNTLIVLLTLGVSTVYSVFVLFRFSNYTSRMEIIFVRLWLLTLGAVPMACFIMLLFEIQNGKLPSFFDYLFLLIVYTLPLNAFLVGQRLPGLKQLSDAAIMKKYNSLVTKRKEFLSENPHLWLRQLKFQYSQRRHKNSSDN